PSRPCFRPKRVNFLALSIAITRTRHRLLPDPRRVLARPYSPGENVLAHGSSRARQLVARVMAIPEAEVGGLLAGVFASYSRRHRAYPEILERHFQLVARHVESVERLSRERR